MAAPTIAPGAASPVETAGAVVGFDPDRAWRLHPQVALRPERFGALAYHFGTRRLSFLKSPRLLAAVEALADHGSARDAVAAHASAPERPGLLRALETLARTEMIVPRESA